MHLHLVADLGVVEILVGPEVRALAEGRNLEVGQPAGTGFSELGRNKNAMTGGGLC